MPAYPWTDMDAELSPPRVDPSPAELRQRIDRLGAADRHRLRRRLDGNRRSRGREPVAEPDLRSLASSVEAAEQSLERRRASVPPLRYPEELPVVARKDDIAAAIEGSQVVVIAGETGSGKTTQLPKICLELGRGIRGQIGHTQPRRLAARSVADRIAEELDVPLGSTVGYQVRFAGKTGDNTLIKLMTDGILLAEIQHDRDLRRYDTLILDEAHERSLNIDFLLGYLKQLLSRRPDLKLIITSATIDPERFARHFDDAPIVEVSGRTYPVEVRYRPRADEEERDQVEAISDAVDELRAEEPGDILVFLSGEREIRDTADALQARKLPHTEIVPLYARLSAAEQHRVFAPHSGRRIVLATNVAETSLTVPGIRYVIDPGTARISRYSNRLKVQRLPIEPISQASANQRKGRCGRLSEGICIRLYSEKDFLSRPEFTDPEIQRTNLASVILQMTALGLGEIADFPFVDPPDRRHIRDGMALLHELGAIDPAQTDVRKRLTPLGKQLAQLPIEPRFARMVVEADRNSCVPEVLVIAAALSIQDPRERPPDKQQAADELHRRFADPDSDFTAYLNLWRYLQEQQETLSSSKFRRMCASEMLHYLRVREWQDLHGQLQQITKSLGFAVTGEPAKPSAVHASLLAGLLSHIGMQDGAKSDYLGARGARFAVWPGSALFRKGPRWVMAAELVETSRLWGRVVARTAPEEIEPLAGHLVMRSYSEPHWERKRGSVVAYERVTLYGIPLVGARKVPYGAIDPELSRELFIRHALVEGDWHTNHAFYAQNQARIEELASLEERTRRRNIVVDDETLFSFYDKRIPADVVSVRHFDSWWKATRRSQPDLLTFDVSMLVAQDAGTVHVQDYPEVWRQGELSFRLSYVFEPGNAADGVTAHIPLAVLNQARSEAFSWQVPGFREDLVTALIRSLPKALRRSFVPAPNYAKALMQRVPQGEGSLPAALERELLRMTGIAVPPESWDWSRVPGHLRMTFSVEDENGTVLGTGKDLDELKTRLRPAVRAVIAEVADGLERRGLRAWTIDTLPRTVERVRNGHRVQGFPSLVDEGDAVAVRVLETAAAQQEEMARGLRRLLALSLPSPARAVTRRLSNSDKLALSRSPHGSVAVLLDDCVLAVLDDLVDRFGGPVWDEQAFTALREAVRGELDEGVAATVTTVQAILSRAAELESQLAGTSRLDLLPSLADMRTQLGSLVYPGFVTDTGIRRLPDVSRYLQGIERRLDKLPLNVQRDRDRMLRVQALEQELAARSRPVPGRPLSADVTGIRWMLQELRVSFFAEALGTPYRISEERVLRALDDLP